MQEHSIQPWCLYAHFQSTCDTYGTSYAHVSCMQTIEDWARTWNHCHPDCVGDPTRTIFIDKRRVTSWSLFRQPILPEWEHPANVNGITLTHRTNANDVDAAVVWCALVLECVRGAESDDIYGIQVTQKNTRNTTFIKFDVWLSPEGDTASVTEWLLTITRLQFTESTRDSRHHRRNV
jgi:hypothetical protein